MNSPYLPLIDTFRLYAGWLLAWFGIVYSIGFYQSSRIPSFRFLIIDNLYISPSTLLIAFGTFFFLMLSSIHKTRYARGPIKTTILTIVWIIGVTWFAVNI